MKYVFDMIVRIDFSKAQIHCKADKCYSFRNTNDYFLLFSKEKPGNYEWYFYRIINCVSSGKPLRANFVRRINHASPDKPYR